MSACAHLSSSLISSCWTEPADCSAMITTVAPTTAIRRGSTIFIGHPFADGQLLASSLFPSKLGLLVEHRYVFLVRSVWAHGRECHRLPVLRDFDRPVLHHLPVFLHRHFQRVRLQ